jgi:predicted AAA+ superfamily ATPase
LYENAVYLELKRNTPQQYDINYWKSTQGHEVDFVIREGLAIKEIIQVTYELNSETTKDREVRGLVALARESGLDNGLIITKDFDKVETIDGIKVNFMPLWRWLLKL